MLAGATMVVGVLGAIAQDDMKRILSFQIISQIGYMVDGPRPVHRRRAGGAVFYMVHHIVVKTALFLTGGLIEHAGGSSRLTRLGGMVRTAPVVAVLFLHAGAQPGRHPAVVGLHRQVRAGRRRRPARRQYVVVAVALVVSLLTLFSLIEDLDRRVLEPGDERARHATRPRPRRAPRGPVADGGADRRARWR